MIYIMQGVAMMDFFVREVRTVVDGPMAIIRFGTCGGLCPVNAKDGTIVVASKGSMLVTRNYSYFASSGTAKANGASPYIFHETSPANSEMSGNLQRELTESCGADRVRAGLNVTADSFYSSQSMYLCAFQCVLCWKYS
jgi:uridine phosphorylase